MTGDPDDRDRGALSLEQLGQDVWGDPPDGATRLVRTAYGLRRKPVATLTTEDLRLLIGQEIGVEVLVPRALALLTDDPLAEGDFYPGDLLAAVMRVPPEYWSCHPGQAADLRRIAAAVEATEPGLQRDTESFLSETEHYT